MSYSPASFHLAPLPARRRRILLVGIDGLRIDLAADAGLMPTLVDLAIHGSRHRMVVAPPTLSGPSWATILTGATIAEHGVIDNQFLTSSLPRYPDLLSRAFYADQRRVTFAAASWPPLVDPRGFGPIIHERAEQHRAGLHRVVVRDGETRGYVPLDAEMVDHVMWSLRFDTPDVCFLHLCAADEAGHLHGPHSPEYAAALTGIDAHLRRLSAEVARLATETGDEWVLAVTSDHGHLDAGGHGGDSAIERESFVILHRPGAGALDWPAEIAPTEVTPRLLDFLNSGVSDAGDASDGSGAPGAQGAHGVAAAGGAATRSAPAA